MRQLVHSVALASPRIQPFGALILALWLAACSQAPQQIPPVEDRSMVQRTVPPARPASAANPSVQTISPTSPNTAKPVVDPSTLPGAENAGKPGYYTVVRGDSLSRIGLEHGQGWRDLARWNQLSNPNEIEVGQVLRVVPPDALPEANGVVSRPVTSGKPATTPPVAPASSASSASARAPSASTASAPASALAGPAPAFAWPVRGAVLAPFDEARNKGLDFDGKAGDPVMAAADGQVVYAGSGLRGYGQLVIIKHDQNFLSAYAHNQKLLVQEDQKVNKGQVIAEMGSSDADRVKLHFEIRRQGKPVDPSRWLPAR